MAGNLNTHYTTDNGRFTCTCTDTCIKFSTLKFFWEHVHVQCTHTCTCTL